MEEVSGKFTQGPVARHILVMTSTSALSLLAVFLVDILTLVYVAMLHDPLLVAAVGIAKVLIFANGAISSGLIIAAASVLSSRIGKRASAGFARLTCSLILMTLLMSGITASIELALVSPITHWLGADDSIYPIACSFIWLTLPFAVLQSAMQMCAQMLRTTGDSRRAMWVVLSGAATLAVADPLLIFVFDLGLKGAGLAYAVSAIVSASLGIYWVRRRVGLRFSSDVRLLRQHVRVTFKIALPAIVGNVATPIGLAYLFSVLATYGASTLAAMAVVDRVMQFSYCAFFALPSALAPVLGQNIGADRESRVTAAVVFTRRLVVVYGLAIWAVLILLSSFIADLYELQGQGRAMFLAFCYVGGGLWAVIGLDFVAMSVFVTMGRPWLVAVFAWLRATAGTLPFVYVGTHLFGGSAALPGMFTGNALIAIVSIVTASLTAKRFFANRTQPA
jgi:Na+-driven multidrug efflux pump